MLASVFHRFPFRDHPPAIQPDNPAREGRAGPARIKDVKGPAIANIHHCLPGGHPSRWPRGGSASGTKGKQPRTSTFAFRSGGVGAVLDESPPLLLELDDVPY